MYGNGKSLSMYFEAFLSFFSLMMTWLSPASLRSEASIPAIFLTNFFFGFLFFFAPLPAHEPCRRFNEPRSVDGYAFTTETKQTYPSGKSVVFFPWRIALNLLALLFRKVLPSESKKSVIGTST